MPTNHDAVPALPSAGGANHTLLRNLLVKRMAYCLTADEDSQDLVAVDPQSGATILALLQNGRVYALDPDDTTSAHDGTAVLVSYDGKRYKLDALSVPYHVLDKDLTEPPESPEPEIGDAYLLVEAGTGDWAGLEGIVTLTGRGWEEIALPVGRMVYVADEDAYYHRRPTGEIVSGLGVGSISEGSLTPRHLLRGGDLVTWHVISQELQEPPESPEPSEGDTYIVAAGGTGDWAGWDGSVVRLESGVWRRYQPATGWRAFDADLNTGIIYQSPNWIAQASGYNQVLSAFASSDSLSAEGGNVQGYAFSSGTPPTQTTSRRVVETLTLTLQAQYAGQVFDVDYQASITACTFTGSTSTWRFTAAVFLDAISNAHDWTRLLGSVSGSNLSTGMVDLGRFEARFRVELPDTDPHTLTLMIFPFVTSSVVSGGTITLDRRRLIAKRRA